jgi:hypothetical protein
MGVVNIHGAAEELDLEGDDSFGHPDHCEDAAEDLRALIIARVDRQEERQEQAE